MGKRLLIILCLLIFKEVEAVNIVTVPSPAGYATSGMAFIVTGLEKGIYNFDIKIFDALTLVYKTKINNHVINSDNRQVIYVWNLRNHNGRFAAAKQYELWVEADNINTPTSPIYKVPIGIQAGGQDFADFVNCKLHTSSSGDKIYEWNDNISVNKAIICFEGFDPLNETAFAPIMTRYNFVSSALISEFDGWDIFCVSWKNGGAPLAENGNSAIEIVNMISNLNGGYEELMLAGFSMGGVIARYALAKSESDGNPLPIKKFVSIDAPQQGAQINLCFQAIIYHLDEYSNLVNIGQFLNLASAVEVEDYRNVLYSGAAKDMLYYHIGMVEIRVPSWDIVNKVPFDVPMVQIWDVADYWHDSFYAILNGYGKNGYPSYCKNYAISFSSKSNYYSDKIAGEHMANFDGPGSLLYNVISDPEDVIQASYIDFRDIAEYLERNGYDDFINFVPLTSALDLKGISNVDNLTIEEIQEYSAFHKIYIRGDEYRCAHANFPDDIIVDFFRDIVEDNDPVFITNMQFVDEYK